MKAACLGWGLGLILVSTVVRAAPLFFVTAEADQLAPRVQAEVMVRIGFYQGADVRGVKFRVPSLRLADVEVDGDPMVREVQRDGKRYRLHEQQLRVRPFASGPLALAGLGVEGRRAGSVRNEQWLAPALHLNVRPAPSGTEHWLPARQLNLRELPVPQPAPAVGQPWLRTLVIEGDGVDAAALPEVSMVLAGATVIARPPRTDYLRAGNRRMLVREQTFEILPQRAGRLTLPPLTMLWWDMTADAPASSRLPGRTLAVAGAVLEPLAKEGASGDSGDRRVVWIWAALAGALMLALIRVRHFLRFVFACLRGNPGTIRRACLEWGRGRWPENPPSSLIALAQRLGPGAEGLTALDRCCYGVGGRPPGLSRLAWRLRPRIRQPA